MAHQKLAVAALVVMAMLAMATASSYTTTITTNTYEEGREREMEHHQQRCRQQVQEQGRTRLQNCERYLSQPRRGGGRFGRGDEIVENPFEEQEQSLRQCCQELRNFDEECQCEAIKQVTQRAQQEQGQGWGGIFSRRGQSEEVYEKARELPRRCNLRMEQCSFRLVFV